MGTSGYRAISHIYIIFFLSIFGTIVAALILFFMLITVQKPNGETDLSNWANVCTEDLGRQIVFVHGNPRINETGLELLRDNQLGIQILDSAGSEVFSFQKPGGAKEYYSNAELLRLEQIDGLGMDDITSFIGTANAEGKEYVYIVYFPGEIKKVTMYLNGERFSGGKTVIFFIGGVWFLVVAAAGVLYGLWTANILKRLTSSIYNISARLYQPLKKRGMFGDLFESLNQLDRELKAGDALQEQIDTLRREWITNITHDLKSPLSPIKGYAELLKDGCVTEEQRRQYAGVMLKNTAYLEQLIDDMKLAYQLENGVIPVRRREQNLVRFMRELAIDILNRPEYEHRGIQFKCDEDTIVFSFDQGLLTRAFQNIILNAFIHGDAATEIAIQINVSGHCGFISVADNGRGMAKEDTRRLFEPYYRGTNASVKSEGTGLGLAIAKSIVELHNGSISVSSIPGSGTSFLIVFPLN